ncbi:MAG: bifunctional [glutamine synthetase] adenylyltransferase/[glutamine synthetase]-adenylyl-L-tyrosine phosphorylase [Propionibacteriaceae bacterium]|nr:bifunctional [glutamine synthetase] adenylyltransferase/[glutamine synthetase]-adenylyl-L-tyrosine phosphorylase [Propionibacteriaceae bacterium]
MQRIESLRGSLARLGFNEIGKIVAAIETWTGGEAASVSILEQLAASADPDAAFAALERMVGSRPGLASELAADPQWLRRLAGVLGSSPALGQYLVADPALGDTLRGDISGREVGQLRAELLSAIGVDPAAGDPVADPLRSDDLRRAYRKALLRIAARDATAPDPMAVLPQIAQELADLADATVTAALALARGEVRGWEVCRLGVVAMGKAGARELNYVSDVDLIYVAEPALDSAGDPCCDTAEAVGVAAKLVAALSRICSAYTAAGTIWQIDPNLRPEGKNGPLVRSLGSHRSYYEKWAQNWEFQALLKARPMAGDLALAQAFVDVVWPMVWKVADDDRFVPEVQEMRQRVIALLPAKEADYEIKLGAGGLRDVEFSVQLLQLVHGRTDERLRLRGTFAALDALVAYGYVGRSDGSDLANAYRLQRVLEHRVQLYRLQRTHLMPTDEHSQRWLARSVGLGDPAKLLPLWRATARRVLALHQRMFYSPLLEAVARIPSAEVRLTSQEAEARLRALGYGDPKAALKHIAALSQGFSRQAEIQRQILPAMLGWFSAGPNPDHGLLAFRQVSERLGRSPWYLRALRDGDVIAERFAKILASSRYAVELLMRDPPSAALLNDPSGLLPRSQEAILDEMQRSGRRHESQSEAIAAVRAVRRSELLRLAMGDLIGDLAVERLGQALSAITSATIDAALEIAARGVDGVGELAVVAMGRWGGHELSYASDADAIFVLDDDSGPDAIKAATTVISRLRALLSQPGPDPALRIDADLRPEGKQGPIVRTLSSYAAYYQRWSSTWELQALLRADVGAGSRRLAKRLLAQVVDPIRYPKQGLLPAQVQEIRKLKARMESERVHGDASRNTKLGPGGLSDVEWVVQLLQLRHVGENAVLRDTTTLGALRALEECGLVAAADAACLREAWLLASRVRNAVMLLRGRASDLIPTDMRELSAVAGILGYPKGESSLLFQEYRRATRLARQVMDRLFWGVE